MNEICGNAKRLPVTVHIPGKANVSKVTLWSGTSYKEPERNESFGESSKTKDKGDILTKRSGPDETEPVAEPQINQGSEENSRETTKEPDEEDIEETICQKSRFARATRAHQLAEKKAERKQGPKRASRRIIGPRIEKKKGHNKEGGSPTKPGENPTATFSQPVQEANIDNPLAIPAAQKETPVPKTDLQENQDKEGKCNQERKRKDNRAAKQKKETKKPRVVLSAAIIIKKLGQVPKLIGSKEPEKETAQGS
ncbi:serine/arginine repetitive matrix protein 1-like [Salvia splendens]|uniref:serine/arginine repetitive matrix protein 1-like n=1 Tax=Salvia splendens TaxID=180675 RepID=UPI001C278CF4|nr:serine/arginine repetitive matrix protein 1-like [Salvia splendens]